MSELGEYLNGGTVKDRRPVLFQVSSLGNGVDNGSINLLHIFVRIVFFLRRLEGGERVEKY